MYEGFSFDLEIAFKLLESGYSPSPHTFTLSFSFIYIVTVT